MLFGLIAAMLLGDWKVEKAKDPMSDKSVARVSLRGDNAALVFTCSPGTKPTFQYVPDEFLGSGYSPHGTAYGLRDFMYRFDQSPPRRESWKHLDRYAVPYNQKATVSFVTSVLGARGLVVRAERYDRKLIESKFDISGAAPAFHDAFQSCGIR